jgi:Na+/melibiose symporter-like transporter
MSSSKSDVWENAWGWFVFMLMIGTVVACMVMACYESNKRMKTIDAAKAPALQWIAKYCGSKRIDQNNVTIYKCGANEYRFASIANIFIADPDYKMRYSDE